MRPTIDVALLQLSCSDDVADNVAKTVQQIRTAANQGTKKRMHPGAL